MEFHSSRISSIGICATCIHLLPTTNSWWKSVMFAVRAVHVEEVALMPVSHMFLEEEYKIAVLERLEPLLPAHRLQLLATVAREVDTQHAEMIAMFCPRYRCRCTATLLRPVFDDFRILRCQCLSRMVFVFVEIVNPLCAKRRGR